MGGDTTKIDRGEGMLRASSRELIGKFLDLLPHSRGKLFVLNAVGVLGAAMQFAVPLLSASLINSLAARRPGSLLRSVAMLFLVSGAGIFLSFCETQWNARLRDRFAVHLHRSLFSRVQQLPYLTLVGRDPGELMSRISNDGSSALDVLGPTSNLGRLIVSLAGGGLMLPLFARLLGWTLLLCLGMYGLLIWHFRLRTRKAYEEVSARTADMSRELFESLSGVVTTRMFAMERRRVVRLFHYAALRCRASVRAKLVSSAGGSAGNAIALLMSSGLMLVGSWEILSGRMTLGNLVGVSSTFAYLLTPLNQGLQHILALQSSCASIERVLELYQLPQEDIQSVEAPALFAEPGPHEPHLEFSGVAFAYPNAPALFSDVRFRISRGETVLLTGPSGSGKTSLLNLIPRLLEPQAGRIMLFGRDIRHLPLKALRDEISFVSQDVFLFSDSIAANISMGNPAAGRAEIEEAARRANACDFIAEMPDGFNTRVGPRGARLSGGQRQRIAIARALLRAAPLLILDEATTNIDRDAEEEIYEALLRLMKGRTTIITSHHRPPDIYRIDRHFTLCAGGVHEVNHATANLNLISVP
jgi:ABC-type multidrug transport system fused ATPase/permease subunit